MMYFAAGSSWVTRDLHFSLLAATQRVHIDRQHLDCCRIELSVPTRHYAAAPGANRLHDVGLTFSVEPDSVGEVGGAHFERALPCFSVTAAALLGEEDATTLDGGGVAAQLRQ